MGTGIQTVFFIGKPQPTGTLSLVEYLDGTLGILRDGQPIAGCRWQVGELDESISAFRDMDRQPPVSVRCLRAQSDRLSAAGDSARCVNAAGSDNAALGIGIMQIQRPPGGL
jgi:hypothetical protein